MSPGRAATRVVSGTLWKENPVIVSDCSSKHMLIVSMQGRGDHGGDQVN